MKNTAHIEVSRNPRDLYSDEKYLAVGRNIYLNLNVGLKFVPRCVPNYPSRAENDFTIRHSIADSRASFPKICKRTQQ